ncbi:MAG TPA: hypothetical protein DCL35_00730 [Candidatus Omnitrophica bacterium]|nr:hypothetical protein [Candidatus Omnitrophota bacterium]
MLTKYFIGINWADFVVIAIVARMCFIGTNTGLAIELFKLFGLWLATVIAFQTYTTPLSDFLNTRVPALPLDAGDVFVFVVVLAVVTIVIRIIRESFFLLVKIEAQDTFNKLAGLLIGLLRGVWISSIALYIMTISTAEYLETSAKSSLFGHKVIIFAPSVYKGSFNGLISKLIPGIEVNPQVDQALER